MKYQAYNQPENHPEAMLAYNRYINNLSSPSYGVADTIRNEGLVEYVLESMESDRLKEYFNN